MDQERWTTRPSQTRAVFSHHREIVEYLDKMLEDQDKLSTSEFHRLIVKKFRVQISAPTIRSFLRLKLNWVTVRARTSPVILDANKIKPVEFAKRCIVAKDSFKDFIWNDGAQYSL